jgi:hypothetical protein
MGPLTQPHSYNMSQFVQNVKPYLHFFSYLLDNKHDSPCGGQSLYVTIGHAETTETSS